jgi:hypothetical protein
VLRSTIIAVKLSAPKSSPLCCQSELPHRSNTGLADNRECRCRRASTRCPRGRQSTRPIPRQTKAAGSGDQTALCCPRKSRDKPAHRCELNNAPPKASLKRSRLNPSFRRTPAFSHSRSAIRAYSRSSGAHLAKAASFRARPETLLLWTHRPIDPIGSPTAIPQSGRRAPRRETNLALAYSAPSAILLRPPRYFRGTLRGASGKFFHAVGDNPR